MRNPKVFLFLEIGYDVLRTLILPIRTACKILKSSFLDQYTYVYIFVVQQIFKNAFNRNRFTRYIYMYIRTDVKVKLETNFQSIFTRASRYETNTYSSVL